MHFKQHKQLENTYNRHYHEVNLIKIIPLLTLLTAIFILQQIMAIHYSIYDVDSSWSSSEKESCHLHTGIRPGR
jgi:hypothetical protein